MKELKIYTAMEARSLFISVVESGLEYSCSNFTRTSKGIPRSIGFVVVAKDFTLIRPYSWFFWYKTFRGAKRAMLNFEKTFFSKK